MNEKGFHYESSPRLSEQFIGEQLLCRDRHPAALSILLQTLLLQEFQECLPDFRLHLAEAAFQVVVTGNAGLRFFEELQVGVTLGQACFQHGFADDASRLARVLRGDLVPLTCGCEERLVGRLVHRGLSVGDQRAVPIWDTVVAELERFEVMACPSGLYACS